METILHMNCRILFEAIVPRHATMEIKSPSNLTGSARQPEYPEVFATGTALKTFLASHRSQMSFIIVIASTGSG